jgi:hypothetical protein
MDSTQCLHLPLLAPAQAQKHVTHNEALMDLDVLCQTSVLDRSCEWPPSIPREGDRYLIPRLSKQHENNVWQDKGNTLTVWRDSGWHYYTPKVGWIVFVQNEEAFVFWNGQVWKDLSHRMFELQNLKISRNLDKTESV